MIKATTSSTLSPRPLPLLALAQINPTVGDIAGNCALILKSYQQAAADGAELVVFPELAITGYSPEDLLLMPAFRKAAMDALQSLATHTKGSAAMIVGCVWDNALVTSGADTQVYNAAVLLDDGRIQHVQPKAVLPNFGVFDEERVFSASTPEPMEWRGRKLGVLVCEDTWHIEQAESLKDQGAEILISINASPFETDKDAARKKIVSDAVQITGLPLIYVNMVGGQDEVVFDGGSFVMSADGKITTQLPWFEEKVASGEWRGINSSTHHSPLTTHHSLWNAMQLGLRDYVRKNGFSTVMLGLSGGIDSALTAACAVDALGKNHVKGVLLPSPYTSKESTEDALALAKNLGIETFTIPITPAMQTMDEVLSPVFKDAQWMEDVAVGGNLQARLRGLTLMALSNKFGWLLLTTGNKSEIAVGYSTLYGDACGAFNVIKDLYKTEVYTLAEWRNSFNPLSPEGRGQGEGPIPKRSITKAPSAELKPGQTDQDQLPPYEMLDAILKLHIEGRLGAEEIIAKGYERAIVEKIVRLVRTSEYKRRQSAPGVKLSLMQFGKDRRYPLTNKF